MRKSISLHGTRRIILMLHSDCGAYGGLASFQGDVERERVNHRDDLRRAAEYVAAAIPGVAVETYFVDFEGVWTLQDAAVLA